MKLNPYLSNWNPVFVKLEPGIFSNWNPVFVKWYSSMICQINVPVFVNWRLVFENLVTLYFSI